MAAAYRTGVTAALHASGRGFLLIALTHS